MIRVDALAFIREMLLSEGIGRYELKYERIDAPTSGLVRTMDAYAGYMFLLASDFPNGLIIRSENRVLSITDSTSREYLTLMDFQGQLQISWPDPEQTQSLHFIRVIPVRNEPICC